MSKVNVAGSTPGTVREVSKSTVSEQVATLDKLIAELTEVISAVEEKLTPICSPAAQLGYAKVKGLEAQVYSPLVSSLVADNDALAARIQQLNALVEQVQI